MKTTFSQSLPYPEGEDYALGSLDLQVLAEAVNAKLVADHARYDSILATPLLIGSLSAPQNIGNNGQNVIIFDTVVYDTQQNGAIGPYFSMAAWPNGIYQAGVYCPSNPTGAVTVGSTRKLFIVINDFRGPSSSDRYTEEWVVETLESNSAGEHQVIHASFEIHSPERATVQAQFQEFNTGSSVNILAGAYWWLARIGDLG